MVLPQIPLGDLEKPAKVRPNFSAATLSPSEALKRLESLNGEKLKAHNIQLLQILNNVVYHIQSENGHSHLIDAHNGEKITIDVSLAQRIALSRLSSQSQVVTSDYVDHYSGNYFGGALPVFKFSFNDPLQTVSYVSAVDGSVRQTHRFQRIRTTIEGLHSFDPIRYLSAENAVRKLLLLLVSMVGIAAVGSGFLLAIFRLRK